MVYIKFLKKNAVLFFILFLARVRDKCFLSNI